MWDRNQIQQHTKAAQMLGQIKNDIAKFIRENPKTTELEVREVVMDLFRAHGLKQDAAKHKPIVAFGRNTSNVHYFVNKKSNTRLKKNTLILLDIWARLNQPRAPYADMTWMFYHGEHVPEKAEKLFAHVLKARDLVTKKIKDEIKGGVFPVGADLDKFARDYLNKYKFGRLFKHSLGHSLGTHGAHGIYGGLRRKTKTPIVPMLGYTIEPGLYFKNKYGFRSEIDFYINRKNEMVITTPVQRKIKLIRSTYER